MPKTRKTTIDVQGTAVTIVSQRQENYISLTDIARFKNSGHSDDVIRNRLRNRSTIEFLGVWERLKIPEFNPVEFDGIRMQAGLKSFTLTPKQWIERTGAAGIWQAILNRAHFGSLPHLHQAPFEIIGLAHSLAA